MRHLPVFALLAALALPRVAHATSIGRDAHMDSYLATWARNADVTPATVGRLYARHVVYYGQPMSVDAVYRDKLAFIRRWPQRSYATVPGTVTNDCGSNSTHCRVSAVLRWTRADRSGQAQSGTNSVRLDLVREDGTLKIRAESGEPVGRR